MDYDLSKNIIVLYHGQCRDGFTAAWAAWKKLGDQATYIPIIWTSQSDKIPDLKDKEIYFLDYCPIQEKLDQIVLNNKSVQIIDHHISRENEAKSLPNSIYEENHSAAVLSWKFFHPNEPIPELALYVEDADLWNWKIQNSEEVLDVVDLKREFDFKNWDMLASDLESPSILAQYKQNGALLKEYRLKVMNIIIDEHAQLVEFEGHKVYAINAPRFFRSDLGSMLYEKRGPFAIVWSQTSEEISVSLRSLPDFDLLPIASKYRGGGHKNAANFRLPLSAPLPWKIIKEDEK